MTGEHESEPTLDDLLADVSDLRRFRDAFVSMGPSATSPAASDGALPFGGLVLAHGATTLGVGLDHLEAWASVFLEARVFSPYAPFTLIRASLEGSVLYRWLIDPQATREVRATRAASLQLRDLREREKAEDALGISDVPRDGDAKSARDRVAEHRAAMTEARVGEVGVNVTALFEEFGPGEWAYRMLSGFAHGYMSAAMLISRDDGADARDTELEGVLTVRRLPNPLAAAAMTNAARNTLMRALRELRTYYGREEVGFSRSFRDRVAR